MFNNYVVELVAFEIDNKTITLEKMNLYILDGHPNIGNFYSLKFSFNLA